MQFEGSNIGPKSTRLSKDGNCLFVIGNNGQGYSWNTSKNKLVWQCNRIPDFRFGDIIFDDFESKLLIRRWNKAVLIDAFTGEQEAVVYEHSDQENTDTICTDFYEHSNRAIVLHNGCLKNESNKKIEYRKAIPLGAYSPLYNRKQNKLIYFFGQDDQCCRGEIVNLATDKKEQLDIVPRVDADTITLKLVNKGNILLRMSNGPRMEESYCCIDLYDLVKRALIGTIKCDSQPSETRFNNKKNILFLALKNQLCLYDIATQLLSEVVRYQNWLDALSIHKDGDNIVVVAKNYDEEQNSVVVWQKK